MKLLATYFGLLALACPAFAVLPVVSNVASTQRAGTKFVDITYDVADADGDALKIRVEISDNNGASYNVPAFTFIGAIGDNVTPGTGKTIVWNAGQDWDGEYSNQMRVKVIAVDAKGLPGLAWSNEIPPGGFLMGQDGGAEGSGPSRHVNIPWSYWLSKFEITNDQYAEYLNTAIATGALVRDGLTSVTAVAGKYTGVPAGGLIFSLGDSNDIRWNVSKVDVVAGRGNFPVGLSWYGAVAFAQHYGYDLPTQAEWEKAARGPDYDDAGQHRRFPWGNSSTTADANLLPSGGAKKIVGYYNGNQTPLGPDRISAYGMYDMIGNVREWTRSVSASIDTYVQQETLDNSDNILTNTNSSRVYRGASYADGAAYNPDVVNIYFRTTQGKSAHDVAIGFRVIRRSAP